MPSFLSKVFTRKKDEKDASRSHKRSSVQSLLEGKFEAVSPTISPSAANFPESTQAKEKEKEKDVGFSLFRAKSGPISPNASSKSVSDTPHLTLNLPVPKEEKSRALGVVFEADPDDHSILSDSVIGEKRLSSLEALLLVKACATAIVERGGLETLGVMHPHWYSASPEVQRRLISLFILSLAPKSPITTLSPTPTSPIHIFNTELAYTRSPHDVAAVLRWALRHLRLEGDSFGRNSGQGTITGSSSGQWRWYTQFAAAERAAAYPPNAFSSLLVPELPPTHLQLLVATLEIVSSLAAHAERSGVSGGKLSKVIGLWLLTSRRVESSDDWTSFYARWERAGRILEHLFLAQIRDEMAPKKMPLRLSELVQNYPYNKGGITAEVDDFLPRPRLSSRRYDALFVRVETQFPDHKTVKPKQHPLRLIADAIKAEANTNASTFDGLWDIIKKSASSADETEEGSPLLEENRYPTLSRVFSDETIRLLSLIPVENPDTPSPTIQVSDSSVVRTGRPVRRRSTSLGSAPKGQPSNGKATENVAREKAASNYAPDSPNASDSPKDWVDFSASGFGETALGKDFAKTLLDNDLEVTAPRKVARKSSKKRKASPERSRRSSADNPSVPSRSAPSSTKSMKAKTTLVNLIKLDEAFVDFWSDALLDPIAANWPSFVVCQLKPLPGLEVEGKPVEWLVLEQAFTRPPPPPEPQPMSPARASSPGPSVRSTMSGSRKSSTFSATKRRFTFFSSNHSTISSVPEVKALVPERKKPSRVNELGEMISEEEEKPASSPAERPDLGLTGVSAPAPAATVITATATAGAAALKTDELPPVPVVSAEHAAAPHKEAATTLPIKTEEQVERPLVAVPLEVAVPGDVPTAEYKTEALPEKVLPSAPETVVLAGENPGPHVALNTSEPVALAEVSAQVQEGAAQDVPSSDAPPTVPKDERPSPATAEPAAQTEDVVVVDGAEVASAVDEATLTQPAVPEHTLPAIPQDPAVSEESAIDADLVSDAVKEDDGGKPDVAEPVQSGTTVVLETGTKSSPTPTDDVVGQTGEAPP